VGGTIWMKTGDLQGVTIRPTSKTSGTVLAFAAQSTTIDVGDDYALADNDFNIGVLRRSVNEALREYAKRRTTDDTLTVVLNQETYELPEGVSDVKQVWVAQETAEPYGWIALYHWDEHDGELRFPKGFTPSFEDHKLRVVYRAAHEDLTTDADQLPADVSADLIHWQAAVDACRDGMMRFHGDPKRDLTNKMNEAQARLLEARRSFRPWSRSVRAADY